MPSGGGGGGSNGGGGGGGLPEGWKECYSNSKKMTYWRHADGRTSWTSPGTAAVAPAAAAASSSLPAGWTEVFSKSKNKPYWRNDATGETTWSPPLAGGGAAGGDELPAGWTSAVDEASGATFYSSALGVQWERPMQAAV